MCKYANMEEARVAVEGRDNFSEASVVMSVRNDEIERCRGLDVFNLTIISSRMAPEIICKSHIRQDG